MAATLYQERGGEAVLPEGEVWAGEQAGDLAPMKDEFEQIKSLVALQELDMCVDMTLRIKAGKWTVRPNNTKDRQR